MSLASAIGSAVRTATRATRGAARPSASSRRAASVGRAVLRSPSVQHVARSYSPSHLAHGVLASHGVQHASASARRSSPSRAANQAARRTSAIAQTVLRDVGRQSSIQKTLHELNHPAIPNVFKTKIAPTGIAKKAAVTAAKVPTPKKLPSGRSSKTIQTRIPTLQKVTGGTGPAGTKTESGHVVKLKGGLALSHLGKSVAHDLGVVGQVLTGNTPDQRIKKDVNQAALQHGIKVPGQPFQGVPGTATITSHGLAVKTDTAPTFAAKVIKAGVNDAINTPVQAPQALYQLGHASVNAAQGNTKELAAIGKGLKDQTFLGNLLQGNFKKAGQQLEHHPVNSILELSGAKAVVGRFSGGTARIVGRAGDNPVSRKAAQIGSTTREPLRLYKGVDGGPTIPRKYSRDSINKAVQKIHEAAQRSIGHDPNVAHGRRAKHALNQDVNANLAMTEAKRREATSVAPQEVARATRGGRTAVIRTKAHITARGRRIATQHHTPGLQPYHEPAVPLAVDNILTTPKNVVRDLQRYQAKLAKVDTKTLTRDEAGLHEQTLKQVGNLLADRQFLANPKPAFDAAKNVIKSEAPRTQTLRAAHMLSPEEQHAAYVPYAIVHMDARPALHPADVNGVRRAMRVPTDEYQAHLTAKADEAQAATGVRTAARALDTAKRHEARSRGAAEVRVGQADARMLRNDPRYRDAALSHSRATSELQAARRVYGNAARNPHLYSDQQLTASVARLRAAERTHGATRAEFNRVKAQVTDELKGRINTAPTGTLRGLQRRSANVQAAQGDLLKAKLVHEAARARRIATKVPKSERSHVPLLVDAKGKPVTVDQIKAHMQNPANHNGDVVAEPGFYSQRPGATGARSWYHPLVGKNMRRPVDYTPRRTGLAAERGTYDASTKALQAQAAHSANLAEAAKGFDFMHSRYTIAKAHDSRGKAVYFRSGDEARAAAKEMAAQTGHELVPINVGQSKAIQDLLSAGHPDAAVLAGLSDKVHAMFNADGHGQFGLAPKALADRLAASVARRSGPERTIQELTRLWKSTVLAGSTKWLAGNVIDIGLRSFHEGLTPIDLIRGHQIIKSLERTDPEAAAELRARIGGNFYHAQEGMETFRPPNRIQQLPAVRQVAWLWKQQKRLAFGANTALERNANYAALGKFARQEVQRNVSDLQGFFKVGDRGLQDVVHGLHGTEGQLAAAKFVERIFGRWGKMSPDARRFLIHAPFVQWLHVATKYVYVTLPAHHPIKTAIYAAMNEMSEKERKALGLNIDIFRNDPNQLKDYLQGGITSGPGKGIIPFQRYSSFGIPAGFPASLSSFAIPQFQSALDLWSKGIDWQGNPIKNKDGSPLTAAQKGALGAYVMAEGFIPWISYARRLQEGGGASTGTSTVLSPQTFKPQDGNPNETFAGALNKVFNPFRHLAPKTQVKPSSSGGGGPSFDGGGGGGGASGSFMAPHPQLHGPGVLEGEGAVNMKQLLAAVGKTGSKIAKNVGHLDTFATSPENPGVRAALAAPDLASRSQLKGQKVLAKPRIFAHPGRPGTGQFGKQQVAGHLLGLPAGISPKDVAALPAATRQAVGLSTAPKVTSVNQALRMTKSPQARKVVNQLRTLGFSDKQVIKYLSQGATIHGKRQRALSPAQVAELKKLGTSPGNIAMLAHDAGKKGAPPIAAIIKLVGQPQRLQAAARVLKHAPPVSGQKAVVYRAARKYGVPPEVLWGVYGAESNFGKNRNNSNKGAMGPFQFIAGTANSYIPGGVANVHNFPKAAEGAAKYLRELYSTRGHDWQQATAGYNAGGGVSRNPAAWPSETKNYVPEVVRLSHTFGKGGRLSPKQQQALKLLQSAQKAGVPIPKSVQHLLMPALSPSSGVAGVQTSSTGVSTASPGRQSSSGGRGGGGKVPGAAPAVAGSPSGFDPLSLFQFFQSHSAPSGKSGDDLMALIDALTNNGTTSTFASGKARNIAPKPLPVNVPKAPPALKSLARR